jgi:CHAT domain-containing protein
MGDPAKALPHYERALAIYEKSLGLEHPDIARSLNNMALIYFSMEDHAKALPFNERALSIHEKSNGHKHPDTAISINNLALIYASTGDAEKAHLLYDRALSINEKALGPKHPQTAMSLGNLAVLKYETGSLSEAIAYADRHITAKQSELQTILAQDEGTRLSWQSVNQPFWLACLLEPDAIADLVLRMKGVVLDSLVEDRSIALAAQSSSEGAESLKKISQLQAHLSKLAFEPGQEEEVTRLKGEISQLQRDMAAKYLGRNLQRASATITQADITAKLGEDSALIDVFQFHDPKLKRDEWDCLGAIIMAANNKLEFVRIDGAKAILQAIESLRQGIANGDAACVKEETELLSEKLWRPIAQKIPEGTNRLVISPDGDLNFLSFAALLGEDGKFLAESYDISYVGNARDLLRESNPTPSNRIRIFGNPIFDQATEPVEENGFAFRSMEVDVFGQIQLPSLPGTEKECAEIQKIAANSGWDLETFTRDRADEKNIRGTSKPGILHLATHGFYLNSYTPPTDNTRGMSVIGIEAPKTNKKGVDPMRASGIALTGAQSTLRSWAERKAPDPENDGILTAEEVAALDLQGTWLVSLSACETGVGEARSGEGVLGLRRSFMMAGAENLLMTLWPVSDQTTSEIMADFYREALKTGNAPGSLAKVQREWLVKLRKEKGLLEAVRDAGPFVMATIGKPMPPLPREPAIQESLLDKVGRKIEALIQSNNADIKNN